MYVCGQSYVCVHVCMYVDVVMLKCLYARPKLPELGCVCSSPSWHEHAHTQHKHTKYTSAQHALHPASWMHARTAQTTYMCRMYIIVHVHVI